MSLNVKGCHVHKCNVIFIFIFIVILSFLLLCKCASSSTELKNIYISANGIWHVDAVAKEMISASEDDLGHSGDINFGVVAWADSDKVIQAYKPFITYFSQVTQRSIRLIILQDDLSLRNQFIKGNIQLAVVSVINYTILSEQTYVEKEKEKEKDEDGLVYLASFIKVDQYSSKKEYYTATIFSLDKPNRKGERIIKDIDEFDGTILGFINPDSLAGATYPMYTLLYKEVQPYDVFSEISYLGNAANVIDAIDEGSINVGAIESEIFDREQEKRRELSENRTNKFPLNAILTTPCIPFELFVANSKNNIDMKPIIQDVKNGILKYIKDFEENKGTVLVTYDNGEEEPVMNSEKGFPYSSFNLMEKAGKFEDVILVRKTVTDYITKHKFLKNVKK
jgi:ABC-type phosphate/phosphonate transport system substrate-binding protein